MISPKTAVKSRMMLVPRRGAGPAQGHLELFGCTDDEAADQSELGYAESATIERKLSGAMLLWTTNVDNRLSVAGKLSIGRLLRA
jgi:hypothetical protein